MSASYPGDTIPEATVMIFAEQQIRRRLLPSLRKNPGNRWVKSRPNLRQRNKTEARAAYLNGD
jgi:hypothetical protein